MTFGTILAASESGEHNGLVWCGVVWCGVVMCGDCGVVMLWCCVLFVFCFCSVVSSFGDLTCLPFGSFETTIREGGSGVLSASRDLRTATTFLNIPFCRPKSVMPIVGKSISRSVFNRFVDSFETEELWLKFLRKTSLY